MNTKSLLLENTLRQKLAQVHKISAALKWSDPLETHISARIPGSDTILITPKQVVFADLKPQDLVKIDLNGKLLDHSKKVTKQAISVHTGPYLEYQDINCTIHSHSEDISILSSLECGFLFHNQHSLRFYNNITYFDYEGLALNNEGQRLTKLLHDKRIVVLKNHGANVYGDSIEEAVYQQYYFNWCCKMQVKTLAMNCKVNEIPKSICELTKAKFDDYLTADVYTKFFDYLVREIKA